MRSLLVLILGTVAVWLLTAVPLALLNPDAAQRETILVFSATAMLICLVPTGLTLIISTLAMKNPQDQWMIVVGGTGVRMFVTIAISVGLFMLVEYYHKQIFWMWILGAYLVTLALETLLVLRSNATPQTALTGPAAQPGVRSE